MARRSLRTISTVFGRSFLSSEVPYSLGALALEKTCGVLFLLGSFVPAIIEQMRMGVLEHLGIAQAPAWLFAAELREGTVVRLLTPFERTVPILAVRPASRRMSTKVRIFIEHLEKTFVLCSQFNPRPA
jgi:DNA-binding transcriptional LysR family regulator